jgi:RNA polymerase sporulation-specific sigma factor
MQNYGKVEISGVNTYELSTLSWDSMKKLFERFIGGEKEVREELINCNLKLVLSVLKRFRNRGENMDDLFQIGCIGLMKAVDNFKLEHSVNFSTYAVPMILGEIKRYLRDNNYLHMSRSLKVTAQKIQEIREQMLQKNQKEPSITEIAREMGMDIEEIVLAYNVNMDPISLFEPVFSDSTDPLHLLDLIKDMENMDERWLENIALQEALEMLSPREKYIIIARFFQGKTQMEVAGKVGISQAQISRVEKGALRSIRDYYNGKKQESEDCVHKKSEGGLQCFG